LLIIRAWIEEGSTEPLRAEVRIVKDVSAGIERTQTVCRVDDVVAAVQAWLAEFLCGQHPD
jgi:phosphosulfolactate phosphohydrolase-like enzyme